MYFLTVFFNFLSREYPRKKNQLYHKHFYKMKRIAKYILAQAVFKGKENLHCL